MPESGHPFGASLQVTAKHRYRPHERLITADFSIEPGITALVGPSGAGKSTILRIVAGLLRPAEGVVKLGTEVWTDTHARMFVRSRYRKVAYLFQSLALFPHMTAERNVMFGMARTMPSAERIAHAEKLLARFHVSHLLHRKPETFSGGEAQRVALARVLAMTPKVLLLDEPFSALDTDLRQDLCSEVKDLVRELAVPTLLVTHAHDEVLRMASRVITLPVTLNQAR